MQGPGSRVWVVSRRDSPLTLWVQRIGLEFNSVVKYRGIWNKNNSCPYNSFKETDSCLKYLITSQNRWHRELIVYIGNHALKLARMQTWVKLEWCGGQEHGRLREVKQSLDRASTWMGGLRRVSGSEPLHLPDCPVWIPRLVLMALHRPSEET